ncbi:MAG TPA: hypothetical protein VHF89_15325, partial [Solirubrobacteraceae bacterium]|nr:hypothetical protein [Solirubrobacteraceae bacterium]
RGGVHAGAGAGPGGAEPPPRRPPVADLLARTDEVERRFLAFCISAPGAGREALRAIDTSEHFTSPLLARAADHLARHLDDPLAGVPGDDEELAALLSELVARAGTEPATPASVHAQRLQLELRRVDRRLRAARAAGEPVREWAAQKAQVKAELDTAVERSVNSS